ncbi:MAG TPA: hypothetical protein VF142_19245, partial [Longimicrobium sp.]
KIANFYLDKKHGHPFDPEPTLGERWRAGRSGTNGQWDAPNRRLVPPASANAADRQRGQREREERRGTGDAGAARAEGRATD